MNDDLISRKALLEKSYEVGKWMPVRVVAADDIENAPAVEAEPVRYCDWIVLEEKDEHGNSIAVCSECGQKMYFNGEVKFPNYCCTCGAKRRKGDAACLTEER